MLETPRLLLREVVADDAEGFFILDSDPEVARYVGGRPVQDLEQCKKVIAFVQSQYERFGIGRWAVVLKETGAFIGWAGLKRMADEAVNGHTGFMDIGYRFQRRHWGKGYATEAAAACLRYGFETMDLPEICAFAETGNAASRHVLRKIGLTEHPGTFECYDKPCVWFSLSRMAWEEKQGKREEG